MSLSIGTIDDFVKNTELKQPRSHLGVHPHKNEDSQASTFKQQVAAARKRQERSEIENRIKSGTRLSMSDMEYLCENEPDLYKKIMDGEKDRTEDHIEYGREGLQNLHRGIEKRYGDIPYDMLYF